MSIEKTEELETQIKNIKNDLSTDRLDMSFGEICSMYERDELIVSPEFQRLFRWTPEQKTQFIESLLLGIPIPPIFVATDQMGKWELVDGLQRISTVLSFLGLLKDPTKKNSWVLEEGALVKCLDGFSYKELPFKFQLALKRSVCRIEIINWNSKIDMRYELFNRLNTGGSPLTDQEIRNCVFRGISTKFNDFLKRVASNPNFIELVAPTEKQLSELYMEELVLRFTSLYDNEHNIKRNISRHMTEFMESAVKNDNFDYDAVESSFMRVISVLSKVGKDVFRGKNGGFSTSLFEAITIGVAKYIDHYEITIDNKLNTKIDKLKKDEEFEQYMGSAANNKMRIIKRIQIVTKTFEP